MRRFEKYNENLEGLASKGSFLMVILNLISKRDFRKKEFRTNS
jgi:hypothetical protein